jgi:hypothetical protein
MSHLKDRFGITTSKLLHYEVCGPYYREHFVIFYNRVGVFNIDPTICEGVLEINIVSAIIGALRHQKVIHGTSDQIWYTMITN